MIYGDGGGIFNPTTTPPSQVQTLQLIDFYDSGINGEGVAVAADPSINKDFLMLENNAGTLAYGLVRYDLTTYLPEAFLDMPAAAYSGSTWTILRFGQDGLAILSNGSLGISPSVVQFLLVRGPFVTPQELFTNTAATLNSSSSSTITHGSGNTMLTLAGTNLQPGVAVTWNGNYRTTRMVDSGHVVVYIPASDLSSAGTASIVATNPGAPASNSLQITITN